MNQQVNIYHERQCKELCALHALNNIFQKKNAFKQCDLDAICNSLAPKAWVNPHKSFLGLGNYDINVLSTALQRVGHEAVWFDKRKSPSCLNMNQVFGLILNIANETKFGPISLPLNRRHWFAIKEINGDFYNLDSKLEEPLLIGKEAELIIYLKDQLSVADKLLFVIVRKEVAENQSWLKSSDTIRT
ncbi:josephin-like protein [Neocloeon triangulifer]|uniref:josephin-like protein n=1 Tax=Neocloeon triangulifer TaxID=2078957 RepID=UPI00286EF677|nr:josephin-like protein [Neocloeon triangulifer]